MTKIERNPNQWDRAFDSSNATNSELSLQDDNFGFVRQHKALENYGVWKQLWSRAGRFDTSIHGPGVMGLSDSGRRLKESILNMLVIDCQCGNAAAMEELVKRFSPVLLRHCKTIVGSMENAQDIVQESWISIVKGIVRLRDPNSFRSWALKIAHRRSVDFLRRNKNRKEVPFENLTDIDVSTVGERSESDSSEESKLSDAIASLNTEEKSLVRLFYQEGLKVREISRVVSIPEGTVKYMLFQIRKRLKQIVDCKSVEENDHDR